MRTNTLTVKNKRTKEKWKSDTNLLFSQSVTEITMGNQHICLTEEQTLWLEI